MPADHVAEPRSMEGEPTKPTLIALMCSTMAGLYLTYVFFHVMPMFYSDDSFTKPGMWHASLKCKALIQLIVFHLLTVMLLLCYGRAMLSDPGGIPDNDNDWEISESSRIPAFLKEWRGNGNRRSCKWCEKYKPDRSYHCRICGKCILKMDHHCRWINNCVGFRNYKFFFLLLLYTVLDLHFIVWTMAGSLREAIYDRSHLFAMIALLISQTVSVFLGALVTLFFIFHALLVIKGISYIEFCEKTWPRCDAQEATIEMPNYNLGPLQNIIAVFGSNPLFWLLPVASPAGSGLVFPTREVALAKDNGRSIGGRSKNQGFTSYGTWGLGMPRFFRVRMA